jgi:3D-(3,5/4)-trihydroxycyclohexane-1,2-dione acylhydrolase (decyclizing)
VLAQHGTIAAAVEAGAMEKLQDLTLSEALVLGLHNQGVRKYVGILGHGTTDIGEVLRVYEAAGLVRMWNVRHETAAAHAATALKMQTGETAAVITSIGPGAMHAYAGSLCAASNGVGVYHIYGDETTHDEGFNMQQVAKDEQGLFLRMCAVMGNAYALGEPWSVFAALRRGAIHVARPWSGPFFLLAPMNIQPVVMTGCNLLELPAAARTPRVVCDDAAVYAEATALARAARRVCIKVGRGARGCGREVVELAGLLDAGIVGGADCAGIVPYSEPRYMSVGGSKGSISGNFCMNEGDLVVVVGARAVCQWDCSGTAWRSARHIINFNVEPQHAGHYNCSVPIVGDARDNLRRWIDALKAEGFQPADRGSSWTETLSAKRAAWEAFKQARYDAPTLDDPLWSGPVLTQPAAIKIACDFAAEVGAVKFFDAGDVQANGFQIVTDEVEGLTFSDTGSSFMGFAGSALLSGALRDQAPYAIAFCGDASFTMNPQILVDGANHRVRGCVLVFDNRGMTSIAGLQRAQYGEEYRTRDGLPVDYVAWANGVRGVRGLEGGRTPQALREALATAHAYDGLSLIHIPVYSGADELGGLDAFGDWNVGNWCERVQADHHRIGL